MYQIQAGSAGWHGLALLTIRQLISEVFGMFLFISADISDGLLNKACNCWQVKVSHCCCQTGERTFEPRYCLRVADCYWL